MFNLGYSVYLSNFETIKDRLPSLYKEGSTIFTSFHVSEEFKSDYIDRAEQMCNYLSNLGYKIIADVSRKTMEFFQMDNLLDFAHKMNIDILRIDYGYSEEEIIELAAQIPLCINASTLTAEAAGRIAKDAKDLYAMHNFYPRPETGLDKEQFFTRNKMLKEAGIKILAFIEADIIKRGPIYEGLPTLEAHRKVAPYAAYIDLINSFYVDTVFVGDGIVSAYEAELIYSYSKDSIIRLPVSFKKGYENLYQQIFTIRIDSPKWLMRLQESREYSCFGQVIQPDNCIVRDIGAITVDNLHYQRYSGEIQIIKEPLAPDHKVNVIGMLGKGYHVLLPNISNGTKIQFVAENEC
ncbi:MAG: MupG family TIM beta-alpha barrel fold protein [Anaerocolumna sp.]